mgnify:CR=1 FL=1
MWPRLKKALHRTPVNNLEELRLRITEEINDIYKNAEVLRHVLNEEILPCNKMNNISNI